MEVLSKLDLRRMFEQNIDLVSVNILSKEQYYREHVPCSLHYSYAKSNSLAFCQEPPTIHEEIEDFLCLRNVPFQRGGWHAHSIANLIQVVLEHAQKFTAIYQTKASRVCHQSQTGW